MSYKNTDPLSSRSLLQRTRGDFLSWHFDSRRFQFWRDGEAK